MLIKHTWTKSSLVQNLGNPSALRVISEVVSYFVVLRFCFVFGNLPKKDEKMSDFGVMDLIRCDSHREGSISS